MAGYDPLALSVASSQGAFPAEETRKRSSLFDPGMFANLGNIYSPVQFPDFATEPSAFQLPDLSAGGLGGGQAGLAGGGTGTGGAVSQGLDLASTALRTGKNLYDLYNFFFGGTPTTGVAGLNAGVGPAAAMPQLGAGLTQEEAAQVLAQTLATAVPIATTGTAGLLAGVGPAAAMPQLGAGLTAAEAAQVLGTTTATTTGTASAGAGAGAGAGLGATAVAGALAAPGLIGTAIMAYQGWQNREVARRQSWATERLWSEKINNPAYTPERLGLELLGPPQGQSPYALGLPPMDLVGLQTILTQTLFGGTSQLVQAIDAAAKAQGVDTRFGFDPQAVLPDLAHIMADENRWPTREDVIQSYLSHPKPPPWAWSEDWTMGGGGGGGP